MEPFGGRRASDHVYDRLIISKRFTAPIRGDERELPVFHLVPFASARREVADGNRKTRFIRKIAHRCQYDPHLPPSSGCFAGCSSDRAEAALIIADEDKIKQVLLNILQNNLDALPGNGSIKVSTSFMDNLTEFRRMAKLNPNIVFLSFASPFLRDPNDTQYFVIKISDNGEGIPAEKISHIFEPFFTNKDKDTGLGLAMVYRIIKDHE